MGEPKASLQGECQRGAIEELTAEDPARKIVLHAELCNHESKCHFEARR